MCRERDAALGAAADLRRELTSLRVRLVAAERIAAASHSVRPVRLPGLVLARRAVRFLRRVRRGVLYRLGLAQPIAAAPAAQPQVGVPLPEERRERAATAYDRLAGEAASWRTADALLDPADTPSLREPATLRGLTPCGRVAVVAHVYYPELWEELARAIPNIEEPCDVFVSLVEGHSDHLADRVRQSFPGSHVFVVENRGRDILPFFHLLKAGVLFRYEAICKIHTKKSPYRDDGERWRRHLIDGVLRDAALARSIIGAFRDDPDLGIVVAPGQIFSGAEHWAANRDATLMLLARLGLGTTDFERPFAGGSIMWFRPLFCRALATLDLGLDDFEPEPIAADGDLVHAIERLISVMCHAAGMRIAETSTVPRTPAPEARRGAAAPPLVIAHYLPQFHPIPENDRWWGKGFTEWNNVTRARPLFPGHRQPRLPADLGFYDLRLVETREAQAELARSHGVDAFSYYYYWFDGRRLLNRPLEEVLSSRRPDFPFMVCWANEPWTRRWDGLDSEILLDQEYQPGWEERFAADTAPLLHDPRYLRRRGDPVVAIYRLMHIPDAEAAMGRLRSALADQGIPQIHLLAAWVTLGGDQPLPDDPRAVGLDAYFQFPPHNLPLQRLDCMPSLVAMPGGDIYDYAATVDAAIEHMGHEKHMGLEIGTCRHYPGVMAGWDNTARRGRQAHIFHGATPEHFRRWLRAAVENSVNGGLVFINAWNEWAEGTYLEPDQAFGTGWLEAVASAVGRPVRG